MTDDEQLNPFEETAPNPFADDTHTLNPFTSTETMTDEPVNPFADPAQGDPLDPFGGGTPFIDPSTFTETMTDEPMNPFPTDEAVNPFDDPGEHQLIDL